MMSAVLDHKELGYLGRKLINRISWRELLSRRGIAPGWAYVPPPGARQEPQLTLPIVFALHNPRYFHLGDAFFILPLVLSLSARFGPEQVLVCTSPACRQIFELYGARCIDDLRGAQAATLITFSEIYFEELSRFQAGRFVYVNIDRGVDLPIADWHAAVFESRFGVPRLPLPQIRRDQANALAEAHRLEPRTVVVNDVVWSGKFRLRRRHTIRMQDKVDELTAQGHGFCRLGAPGEPSRIVLPQQRTRDLRGAMPIADLIKLAHADQVVASVSYDNFFMHCALWAGKRAFVLCRERPRDLRGYMESYVYRARAAVSPAQLHYL